MSIATLFSSIGTFFASRSSPGMIVVEQSSPSGFHLISCSDLSVTISAADDTINNILEPGSILVYVDDDDDSICNPCHTLFRRIISHENDDTYITAFVTFAEIFPDSVYDDSIANNFIEPMLRCQSNEKSNNEESSSIKGTPEPFPDMKQKHRSLQYPLLPAMACPVFLSFSRMVTTLLWFTGPVGPFCCYAPLTLTVYLWLDPFCGPISDQYERHLAPMKQVEQIGDYVFPGTLKEWLKIDNSGNCLYVDCKINAMDDPSDCFSCSRGSTCSNIVCQRGSNEIIKLPTNSESEFDFDDECNMQDYCYSSVFDKETCDKNFYRTMKDSCPLTPISSVRFPLSESDLNQNCNMMAILLYLDMKGFGHGVYKDLQLKQHIYQDDVCIN